MANLQFTAVHVRTLLGLSRTDLQRWLAALPPFNQAATKARTARHFTINDLALFSIIAILHQRLGLPLASIAGFSSLLHEHVNRTASLKGSGARIYLNQTEEGVWESSADAQGPMSLAVDPEQVWSAVYRFVGVETPKQRDLPFGLVSLPQPVVQEGARGRRTR